LRKSRWQRRASWTLVSTCGGQDKAQQHNLIRAVFTQSGLLTFLRGILADDSYPDGSKFALTADSKGAFGPIVYVPIGEAMYQKVGGKIIALREEGVLEHLLEQLRF
jgi:hypothetical protein